MAAFGRPLRGLWTVAALALVVALAACGGGTAPTASKPAAAQPTAAPATSAPAKPAGATGAPAGAAAGAPAGPPIKIVAGTLAFPSLNAPMTAIIKAQDLARKHGLDMEVKDYSQIAAYYAALATGEVDVIGAGPHVIQRMRNEGTPVQLVSTMARIDATQVLTADPSLRDITDLRGKRLAADMSSSEYQVVAVYARSKGLDLRNDATVVQASLPLARQQLKSGEVDAAMLWDPTVTLALREDNPNYRAIFYGQRAWQELTNTDGWELGFAMRQEYTRNNAEGVRRWIAAAQDAVQLIKSNVDEADAIAVREVKLPPGIFKEAVGSGRMVYQVDPAWEPGPRQALEQMFKLAVDVGYLDKLPPADVIYQP